MAFRLTALVALVFALATNVVAAPVGGNATEIEARQLGDTANDITNGVCRPTTLVFARGTTETGNIGITVGPALATALKSALGSSAVAVQGMNYPADVAGTVTGQVTPQLALGAIDCSAKIASLLSYCPSTRIVIAGYSQGAQQVHGCLLRLTQTQADSVRAAVTFGDPLSLTTFRNFDKISASRGKIYCNTGDAVCLGQFIIYPAHLLYTTTSIAPATQFITSLD